MKKTTYLMFSCLATLLLQNCAKAQFDKLNSSDLKKLKERDIIVVVESPDDKIPEKFNKKGKTDVTDAYKKDIDDYNANMKEVIEKFWKLGSGTFEYMSADDVKAIVGGERKKYAVVYCHSAEDARLTGGYGEDPGLVWAPDIKDKNKVKGSENYYTEMGVVLLDNYKSPIMQLPLPDVFPEKSDIIYGVQVLNNMMNAQMEHPKKLDDKGLEAMIRENQTNLSDKTLLLRRDWLDKLMTKADLEKAYPYPYMIVGRDTLSNMLDSADSKYAFAVVTPYVRGGSVIMVDYIINCEDGMMLGVCMPNMGKTMETAFMSTGSKKVVIGKKNLADLCQYINESSTKAKKKK